MRIDVHRRGQLEVAAILVGALLMALGALVGFALAFAGPLPTGAWVGFGVIGAVVIVLTAVAVLIVTRSDEASVDPDWHAVPQPGGPRRILVVANETIGTEDLRARIRQLARERDSEVLVVAPALNSPVGHWTGDDAGARAAAGARLREELETLEALGVRARGEIGADDPMQAIADALRAFPADEIIVSTHDPGHANWLEPDLVNRAREAYGLPVEHVLAP